MNNPEQEPRIYIADLSAYNNGKLHGAWTPADDEAVVWDCARQLLSTSPEPDAEEIAVHDHEGFEGYSVGEYEPIARIAQVARLIKEHGRAGAVWLNIHGTEAFDRDFNDDYIGTFDSESELEDHLYESYGFEDLMKQVHAMMSDEQAIYVQFDIEQWIHDATLGGGLYIEQDAGTLHAFWVY